jgi:hypothetical protein
MDLNFIFAIPPRSGGMWPSRASSQTLIKSGLVWLSCQLQWQGSMQQAIKTFYAFIMPLYSYPKAYTFFSGPLSG